MLNNRDRERLKWSMAIKQLPMIPVLNSLTHQIHQRLCHLGSCQPSEVPETPSNADSESVTNTATPLPIAIPPRTASIVKLPSSEINRAVLKSVPEVFQKYSSLQTECKSGVLTSKLAREAFIRDCLRQPLYCFQIDIFVWLLVTERYIYIYIYNTRNYGCTSMLTFILNVLGKVLSIGNLYCRPFYSDGSGPCAKPRTLKTGF